MMKKVTQLALMISMVFGLFSCSMVKQPQQTSNFQAVKYNSHLKLAKKQKSEKLEPTVESFTEIAEVEERNTPIETLKSNREYKSVLTASTSKQLAVKSNELKVSEVEEQLTVNDNKAQTIFNRAHQISGVSAINSYLAKPMPVAANPPLGDILYVVLVVVLILIVIGLVADLAGGLVGALIAVLLILLILRFLGYV